MNTNDTDIAQQLAADAAGGPAHASHTDDDVARYRRLFDAIARVPLPAPAHGFGQTMERLALQQDGAVGDSVWPRWSMAALLLLGSLLAFVMAPVIDAITAHLAPQLERVPWSALLGAGSALLMLALIDRRDYRRRAGLDRGSQPQRS